MANNLTIRITARGDSGMGYWVASDGQVTMKNDAAAPATVRFADASPLCLAGAAQNPIALAVAESRSFNVCSGTADQTYGFTSTVEGAAQPTNAFIAVEPLGGLWYNPIFIIQKLAPPLGVTLLLSVATSYFVTKYMIKRHARGPMNGG
jgi:hypothetical protein